MTDRILSGLRCIGTECRKRIMTRQFLCVAIFILTIEYGMTRGVIQFIQDYDLKINFSMAPHFFSIFLFVTYYGFIVCYMFSDAPFMNRSEVYKVVREGRIRWLLSKVVAIIVQSIALTAFSFLGGILVFLPNVDFSNKWGEVVYTMAYSGDMIIGYNTVGVAVAPIIERYTPIQAFIFSFFMTSLITTLIGLLIFAVSLYSNRVVALMVGLGLANMQLVLNYFPNLMWCYYCSPYTWIMIGAYGVRSFMGTYYPRLPYCLCMSFAIIAALLVLIFLKARKMEFHWYKED